MSFPKELGLKTSAKIRSPESHSPSIFRYIGFSLSLVTLIKIFDCGEATKCLSQKSWASKLQPRFEVQKLAFQIKVEVAIRADKLG